MQATGCPRRSFCQDAGVCAIGSPIELREEGNGYDRAEDRRASVALAVTLASSRLRRTRPRDEPPRLRESPRDPAGRDLMREELQQRAQQGDRVLPYLLRHGGRQLARVYSTDYAHVEKQFPAFLGA